MLSAILHLQLTNYRKFGHQFGAVEVIGEHQRHFYHFYQSNLRIQTLKTINALHHTLISKFSSSNVTLRILDSISLKTEFPQLHPPQRAYAVHLEMLEVCE